MTDNRYMVVCHSLYCRFFMLLRVEDFITLNSQFLILNLNISIHPKP